MIGIEQKLLSRREFVKTALAGAVAGSFVRIGQATAQAQIAPPGHADSGELTKPTLSEASGLVHSGKVSPVELTQLEFAAMREGPTPMRVLNGCSLTLLRGRSKLLLPT